MGILRSSYFLRFIINQILNITKDIMNNSPIFAFDPVILVPFIGNDADASIPVCTCGADYGSGPGTVCQCGSVTGTGA
jgi:hypothetical protein